MFICDTQINIKHKISCHVLFVYRFAGQPVFQAKKSPVITGLLAASEGYLRLSITRQALPSERFRLKGGCKTIRELMPI